MLLNEEQKKAAFCTENAVVAAGAGSGKTLVLANRFVWLLTEKDIKVDEILTLTFTKKAAAQMYKRIYSLVSEIAEQEGVKAQRARRALDDFIHARIQTIDSYGASVVKQCASRYGISPDFKIDQERCYNLALEVSYPFFITNRHHPALEKLYSDNRPETIVHKVFADVLFNYCSIDRPRDFSADVKTQFDSLCSEWKNCRDMILTILSEIERDISENNAFLPDLVPVMDKYKKGKIIIPHAEVIREYYGQLLNTPAESVIKTAESHPIKKTFVTFLFFLNSISGISLRGGKKQDNPVKENIKKLRDIMDSVSSLTISYIQSGFIISIMSLFAELQNSYLAKKRMESVLTFKDVANLSRTILLEQTDIRQSEKNSFKAIMIDEFQDNNELQKDLLFLLAEKTDVINKGIPAAEDLSPGKLFFVGDEKQSIYFFRGADVSVFRKLKEEIKSSELPLKTNYRSAPQLINAFNAVFPLVFASSNSLPLYEACYTPLETGSSNKENISSSNLSLCILNKKSNAENIENEDSLSSIDENEAFFVAKKIKQLLTKGYQPEEIAILFRSRSSQYLYEKHLRACGIPYTCEDINDLFYGGPVNDIIAVLCLVARPMDNAAYAEMLRSPFAGLSLPGTAVCLSFFCNEEENSQPFDDRPLLHLDEIDREKYLCGQKIFSNICKKAQSENISSLISELWYNEGYRYETEWNPQVCVYRELYDYLFHLAVNADADNQALASFTDSMIDLRNSGGQHSDIEIPKEHPGAVHLMTIHKSKGLEFPVVFLCGCGKKSQSDSCDTVYLSETAGIVFSPPAPEECRSISGKRNNLFWEQANEETKRKRTAELRRLLYVGMTRAEKELYITGALDIKDNNETGDFSLLLKTHVESKYKNNKNFIENDIIINNDTLFGLLLPSIAEHIPEDGLKESVSLFNLEEIKRLSQEYIKNEESKNTSRQNNQKSLNEFIQKTAPFYEKAQIIKTPILRDNHITPVSLHGKSEDYTEETPGRVFLINKEFSGIAPDDIFKRVDSILSHFLQSTDETTEKFNSGTFGTIAHICVEAHLKGKEAVIPSNISGLLSPSQMTTLFEAGNELAKHFALSPLGKIAKNAKLRESEFSFRSLIKNKEGKEIFINGIVDLLFEDKDFIHIVDFKTDNTEKPWEHTAQMSCYFHAITSLFAVPLKKQCRIWLYYLRTGHAVEMTEKASQFNLEQKTLAMLY